jgi:shikimate kinase
MDTSMHDSHPRTGKNNIVLVGMPGAGKSTIGVLLAKQLSKRFVDTDLVLQHRQKMPLQDILDRHGYLRLREVEEQAICSLRVRNTVIATGGSAVYSAKAMEHLKRYGTIIYLKLGVRELRTRISDFSTRGIAKPPGQNFASLFRERTRLYRHYADATVDCAAKAHEEVLAGVLLICRNMSLLLVK